MNKKGFNYIDEFGATVKVFYLDKQGKDCSFERWRICGYYESHKAKTIFFDSEKEYADFIELHKTDVYQNWNDFEKKFNWWFNGHKDIVAVV